MLCLLLVGGLWQANMPLREDAPGFFYRLVSKLW